ncbi:Piso0_000646 [Millerozyma farinosa CBS 7064]|uniref:Piso0_000646 protein n=1 Tax=Pichia sorbitophila (strain ATCC MYA-4447 / BCRC 22081 / CBS 7064 / NBRC 10061 / NRRL Y-12695) TaxID=559304 RepID=G8YR46_PICSO|nr:Piso0_000646 [Millerozyma farinosa CBS 7064]
MKVSSRSPGLLFIFEKCYPAKGCRSLSYNNKSENSRNSRTTNYGNEIQNNSTENDAAQLTRSIVAKSKQRGNFFDPENKTLDLSLNNNTLYNRIWSNANERMYKRYIKPSMTWSSKTEQYRKKRLPMEYEELSNDSVICSGATKNDLKHYLCNATISPSSVLEPIGVGDIVALQHDSVSLYIVVSCPTKLEHSFYTFINSEGEIVHGTKHVIKLRFPAVIPKEAETVVKNLVQREEKFLDIAPIGIPDASFSRSKASLPRGLKKNSTAIGFSDQGEEACYDETSEVADDFIVAQASSQLLTNSDVNTYHVPLEARNLYSKALAALSLETFEKIPEYTEKLQVLHKALQIDTNRDILNSPKSLSIFQLLKYLDTMNLEEISKQSDSYDDQKTINLVRSQLFNFVSGKEDQGTPRLGMQMPLNSALNFEEQKVPLSSFMSVILALRTQGRYWYINQQNQMNPPLSVNILPTTSVMRTEKLLKYLCEEGGIEEFASFAMEKLNGKENTPPKYYDEIIQFIKSYVAGNFTNDPAAETTIVSILRSVDKLAKANNIDIEPSVPLSDEFSRTRAYELLRHIGYKEESHGVVNPFTWSQAAQLPNHDVSIKSDLSQEYYDYLDSHVDHPKFSESTEGDSASLNVFYDSDKNILNNTSSVRDFHDKDPLESLREDFGDIPIYCIDSETAHEIDDGISIHEDKEGRNYVITVHVANPTSYLRHDSHISSIALDRGSTVYLPEGPVMMLPRIISKIVGLGNAGKTRTFAIQYKLRKATVDHYLREKIRDVNYKPSRDTSEQVLSESKGSVCIKLFNANNFPSGFTYKKVDQILESPENNAKIQEGQLKGHELNLFKLYYIATVLKDIRIMLGNGLEIDLPRSTPVVDGTASDELQDETTFDQRGFSIKEFSFSGYSPTISLFTEDTRPASKSQLLVSQFMIAANSAASLFASGNKIQIIHRTQSMNLEPYIMKTLKNITQRNYQEDRSMNIEDVSSVLSVLTTAKYQVRNAGHESLGVEGYATVTSPLRRFVDMINHWKFEEYLARKSSIKFESFSDRSLDYIASHLQSREIIHKNLQLSANKFWEGTFLREYLKLLKQGRIQNPLIFKLTIQSLPKLGVIKVGVDGFNNLKAKLELNASLTDKFTKAEITVGDTLKEEFEITKLDYIEDELVFKQK